MPLTTLVGKVGHPLGQPLIRKPGDLPAPRMSRVDGVFHDRLVFAWVYAARALWPLPRC